MLKKILSLLLAILFLISFTFTNVSATDNYYDIANQKYQLLQEIIRIYTETSLYETDKDTLISQMIYNYIAENPFLYPALVNALLSANDPYSAYYTSDVGFMSETSKSFGIILQDSAIYDDPSKTEGVYIGEVLPDSNAEFAGLLPGDRFISVEGINVEGLTLDGVRRLVSIMPLQNKEKEKSQYYKKYSDPNISQELLEEFQKHLWEFEKEVDIVVERALSDGSKCLYNTSISKGISTDKEIWLSTDKEHSAATIQITSFRSDDLPEKFLEAANYAISNDYKNLIIDLRDNTGGYTDLSISIAEMFTPAEKVMFYIDKRTEIEPIPEISSGENYIADKFEKIIVLTNSRTASAAELLTYILKEQASATIIGETTYGKALGQDTYSIANGDTFTITTMEILMTDKTSYNEVGITPDIDVPIVPQKYEFPSGLGVFNYINYVEIAPGKQNEPTLALEQRLHLLGLLRSSKVDGLFDDSTKAAVLVYQESYGQENPTGILTANTVANLTSTINSYKDKYIQIDSQMDVANLYTKNKSQAKRLANEYHIALKNYKKMLLEREQKNLEEYEQQMSQNQDEQ